MAYQPGMIPAAPTGGRNGLPPPRPYRYGGTDTSMSEEEVAAHLAGARAKLAAPACDPGDRAATSALATSSAARDAALTPPRIIPGEAVQAQPVIRELRQPPAAPQLKGAVKVGGFPARSLYPFPEIAADGGVWRIDPAAFTWRGKPTKPNSVYTAARKYAAEHGLKVKTAADGGMVYVQFSKDGDR